METDPDPFPEDWPFSAEVTAYEQYSAENPARIRVRVTNEASERRVFTFGPVVPFGNVFGEHVTEDENVYLIPEQDSYVAHTYDELVPDDATDGCWRPKNDVIVHPMQQQKKFRPGESRTREYALLAGETGACLRPGTYRFDREEYVERKEWGFDVVLSR